MKIDTGGAGLVRFMDVPPGDVFYYPDTKEYYLKLYGDLQRGIEVFNCVLLENGDTQFFSGSGTMVRHLPDARLVVV